MKNGKILSKLSILTVLLILSGSALAQRGQRGQSGQRMDGNRARMGMNEGRASHLANLDLSDEQKEKMQAIRAEHKKEMVYNHNLLNEKRAHLKTLLSAPERDKTAINNTIDEISSMRGEQMKKEIANKEEMKGILSPEQIIKLESSGFKNGRRQGMRNHRRLGHMQGRK